MKLRGTLLASAFGLALASAFSSAAFADELDTLNRQIINNPANVELNLRYAQLAEAQGKPRLALAAYERIVALQPGNAEALAGLKRVRVKIQPNFTQTFATAGVVYESNPLRTNGGEDGEVQVFLDITTKDERTLGGTRWRTLLQGTLIGHAEQDQINYGYLNGITGPVFGIGSRTKLHLGLGGGAAMLGSALYYTQFLGSMTFEIATGGATQQLRFRGGYRDFGDNFVSSGGFFADATGKIIIADLDAGRSFIATPFLRYAGFDGTALDPNGNLFDDFFAPGKFVEGGTKLEVLQMVTPWLTVGANIFASARYYTEMYVPFTSEHRQDYLIAPGAAVIIPKIAGDTDLRFDYRYEINNSNDDLRDWNNHRVSVTLGARF